MATWLRARPRGVPKGLPKKELTEADRALWRAYTVAAAVAPLPGRAPPVVAAIAAVPAQALAPPPAPPLAPLAPTEASPRPTAPRPAELQVGKPPGGIDGKRWRDLRRGRTRPERTLDLHGRRAEDAHRAVRRFLWEAQGDGLRCVAIVTGKGSSPKGGPKAGPRGESEGGVLKRELPHWLNTPDLRPLLLGAAHPHAANAGAVHLLLRKRRP